MSASDDGPDGRKELYRRGVAFLYRARDLPELSDAQIDRVERRLNRGGPRARRPILSPALAALVIVLLAGAALAMAGKNLARLPGIGPWVGAHWASIPAPVRGARGAGYKGRADRAGTSAPTRAVAVGGAQSAGRSVGLASPVPASSGPALPENTAIAPSAETPPRTPARAHRQQPEVTVARAGAPPATEDQRQPMRPAPPATAATAPPAIARAPSPVAMPSAASSPAVPPESSITAESRSFASALESWHRGHDAKKALAALDAHERRFPHGQIRLEAQLLRAEILLAGGHEREGLALLDPVALAGLPRARELRTVRGELRIKLGRCVEGKADLDTVLADGVLDSLAQRARRALLDCP